MDQREFNKQMGSYLKERKNSKKRSSQKGVFSSLKDSFSVEIVDDDKPVSAHPDSVSVEDVQAVMRGERVLASEEDDFDEEEFVEQYKPKGFWASLKESLFGGFSEQELLHEEPVAVIDHKPAVDADVKEMLRTCVSWVNRLPPEEISRIKRSSEYEEFKRLLEKYELIKK